MEVLGSLVILSGQTGISEETPMYMSKLWSGKEARLYVQLMLMFTLTKFLYIIMLK